MTILAPSGLGAPYRYLLLSSAVSTLGDGLRFAALPLLAAVLLDSPVQVAAVTAMTTVPWLLLGLPAGAWADRVDRVRMMVVADVLRAVTLVVAVLLLLTGALGFVPLLVVAFLLGVGEVMFDCASFAVLPALVPADRLETANGRLFTVQTVSRDLLGHLLGGLLYTVGRVLPLVVDAVSFVVSAALLNRLPATRAATTDRRGGLWRDIVEGVRHLAGDRLLATLTLTGGVINAVYLGQVAILVLLVRDVLGLGPTGYAMVLAVGALGGVVGGLVADRVVAAFGRTAVLLGGLALMGVSGLGLAAGSVVTVVGGYAAMGFGLMLWNVVAVSLRQSLVPVHLLGRTIGAYRLVAWGTMPAGAVAFGALADAWGTAVTFGVGGGCVLLVAVVVAPLLAGDRRLRKDPVTGGGRHV
ncbi:MFS transporter [Micromonospora sp. CPCC 206060]|uniref:MFS transporter n=1 Tax=Micromonospora sp. CPCC 206060 TaxID=3122406 RepID=UPI002FF1F5B2